MQPRTCCKRCGFLALLLFAAVTHRGAKAVQPRWGCQGKAGEWPRGYSKRSYWLEGGCEEGALWWLPGSDSYFPRFGNPTGIVSVSCWLQLELKC